MRPKGEDEHISKYVDFVAAGAVRIHKVDLQPRCDGIPDIIDTLQHATALLRWESDFAVWQQQDQDDLKAVRKARYEFPDGCMSPVLNGLYSIVAKLADLGYDERDFPVNDQWSKMVDQPKELTESSTSPAIQDMRSR